MTLFKELRTLDSISSKAFQVFGMVKSYEQCGKDILIVCSTSLVADDLFKNYARDMLITTAFLKSVQCVEAST